MIDEERAATLLGRSRTIAVVGMSPNPAKEAHRVPAALVAAGWRVLPVNPTATAILGIPALASLDDVTEPVDLVNVFRPALEAPGVAQQAAAIGAKGLWLQVGIVSAEARAIATAAGVDYVEDICIDVVRVARGITPPRSPDEPSAS